MWDGAKAKQGIAERAASGWNRGEREKGRKKEKWELIGLAWIQWGIRQAEKEKKKDVLTNTLNKKRYSIPYQRLSIFPIGNVWSFLGRDV